MLLTGSFGRSRPGVQCFPEIFEGERLGTMGPVTDPGPTLPPDPGRPVVRMYSRRRCGLCDEARALILSERARSPLLFEEIFIDGDDDLEEGYGVRVPVVEVDGVERFEFAVDRSQLRALLRRRG